MAGKPNRDALIAPNSRGSAWKGISPVAVAAAELLLLSLFALLVPFLVAVDVLILGNRVGEVSLIEFMQEFLLLVSVLLFLNSARCRLRSRGLLVLIAGLFSCMFIRELDEFFDVLVFHGFWVWPAAFAAVGSLSYAMACRGTIIAPLSAFLQTRSYYFAIFGVVTVLVLSRTLGSGQLWERIDILGDYRLPKTIVQEGLELFGYIFICYGAILYHRDRNLDD